MVARRTGGRNAPFSPWWLHRIESINVSVLLVSLAVNSEMGGGPPMVDQLTQLTSQQHDRLPVVILRFVQFYRKAPTERRRG
jgi:hypothetical protein